MNSHWAPILTTIFAFSHKAIAVSSLSIGTSVGTVYGLANGTTPNVAQFLGLSYAESRIGNSRWLPKLKVDSIDATAFGPNCPQHDTSILSVYEADARQFLIPLKSTSEDCLFANIWTPYNCNKDSDRKLLPVIVWIYGGFQTGGRTFIDKGQPIRSIRSRPARCFDSMFVQGPSSMPNQWPIKL